MPYPTKEIISYSEESYEKDPFFKKASAPKTANEKDVLSAVYSVGVSKVSLTTKELSSLRINKPIIKSV